MNFIIHTSSFLVKIIIKLLRFFQYNNNIRENCKDRSLSIRFVTQMLLFLFLVIDYLLKIVGLIIDLNILIKSI